MRPLGRRAAVAAAALAGAAGCQIDGPSAPASAAPGVVLFAVLDPGTSEQVVLLMQSRPSAPPPSTIQNAADPIVASGETPITGARVVLAGAAGDSAVLVEDRVRLGVGSGVYRVYTAGTAASATFLARAAGVPGDYLVLVPGGTYTLRVHTALGDAAGTVRVPTATPGPLAGATRPVKIGRDSVVLPAITTTGAGGFTYTLRAANGTTQEGDTQYRKDLEPRLVLASGGDWAFAYAQARLVVGTRHVLTVQAADSNYFAYYSADTDPFADRSARTSLRGAAGVLGAVVSVATVPVLIVP